MEGATVCVTGGSGSTLPYIRLPAIDGYPLFVGFIGAHVCKVFVEAGFNVRTTTRSLDSPSKMAFFESLGPKLTVFAADLMDSESFDEAFEGCDAILHVASPFFLKTKDPQKELIEPALQGTRNVLRSASKFPSIKRVVVTSSTAAVIDDAHPDDYVFTEDNWNDTATIKEHPYPRSKYLAERCAWDYIAMHRPHYDLVTINPVLVAGPILIQSGPSSVGTSNQLLLKILNREYPGYADLSWSVVDVRDCAKMHLLAVTTPDARGRYICFNGEYFSMSRVADTLREGFPGLVPYIHPGTRTLPNFVVYLAAMFDSVMSWKDLSNGLGKIHRLSNEKGKEELNMVYRDPVDMFLDGAKSLVQMEGTITDQQVRDVLLEAIKDK